MIGLATTSSPLLTAAELAPLLNRCVRTVRNMADRGEFPADAVIFVGRSKHQKSRRFLTAKLLEAGRLLPAQVVALLCFAIALPAADWSLDPALHRTDRQGHAVAGLAIGAVSAALIETIPQTRDWHPVAKFAAATLIASAVGVGKEAYDSRNGGCVEAGDAIATGLGGAAGALVVGCVWRF